MVASSKVNYSVIKNLLLGCWTIKQALAYQKFCNNGLGINNLCASLPRSGYNLLATSLSVAVDLEQGGNGEFNWKNGRWEHPSEVFITCDKRTPLGVKTGKAGRIYNFSNLTRSEILEKNFIFHTHETYESLLPSTKNHFNTLVIIRELLPQITSQLKHQKYEQQDLIDYFVDGHLKQSVYFLNSWGKRLTKQNGIAIASFDQISAEASAETLEKVAGFFNFQISKKNCVLSSELTKKSNMLAKISPEERPNNKRVSVGNKMELKPEIKAYIRQYVDKELREGRDLYGELGISVL